MSSRYVHSLSLRRMITNYSSSDLFGVLQDALRALSGVESTIFRRDVQSVTFKLPEMRVLKLRNGTVKSLTSVLKVISYVCNIQHSAFVSESD